MEYGRMLRLGLALIEQEILCTFTAYKLAARNFRMVLISMFLRCA